MCCIVALYPQSNFKRQPKLPMALLRDLAPKGAVYVVAAKCDDIMAARDLSKIDWPNPAKRKEVGNVIHYGTALHGTAHRITVLAASLAPRLAGPNPQSAKRWAVGRAGVVHGGPGPEPDRLARPSQEKGGGECTNAMQCITGIMYCNQFT